MSLTAERLRELLDYDPETGEFRWKDDRSSRARRGALAGAVTSHGYRQITVDWKRYRACRLAWLYVSGEWPDDRLQVDHVNGDRLDDRLANLRLATPSQNIANSGKRRNNTSGFKGVWLHKQSGLWVAQIKVGRRKNSLGYFPTPEQAHEAYKAAALTHFGAFARAA